MILNIDDWLFCINRGLGNRIPNPNADSVENEVSRSFLIYSKMHL